MSEKPRKQRKKRENASHHRKRKIMSSNLSEELRDEYGTRSLPVREGDEVEIMRGQFKGYVNKVAEVDRRNEKIYVEKVTVEKADESKEPYGIHPSNLKITDLDLSDPWRKEKVENIAEEEGS
ncbi:MAG: 50S ribosomal protein L24 [Candidatus Thermoplasmatota archaeon]|nr:50S ribosomal protein L24 [Candidatus Thermoplasmatota archaeon]